MGWTAPGAEESFLCLDRNGDGVIDSGAELFGNSVLMDEGTHARNGFVALRPYDGDRDSVIDQHDPIWSQLLLWCDSDHDDVSQSHELTPVTDSRLVGSAWTITGRADATRPGTHSATSPKCRSATAPDMSTGARCTTFFSCCIDRRRLCTRRRQQPR